MPAEIEIYAKPVTLWRYRALSPVVREDGTIRNRLEEEVGAIKRGRIWCSSHDKMNDPMEGLYRSRRAAFDNSQVEEVAGQLYNEKVTLGIASFTETWDNELMWAHYAEGFKGICVGYRLTSLLKGLGDDCAMTRVVYADRPRSLNLENGADLPTRARSVLSTKAAEWMYEREWRLFSPTQGQIRHGAGVVTTVVLGSRIPEEDKAYIRDELLASKVTLYTTSVEGYEVTRTMVKKPKATTRPRR